MPWYLIRTVNASFRSSDEGADYADLDHAHQVGLKSALGILRGEMEGGRPSSSVEVIITDHAGKDVKRSVLTLTATDLLPPIVWPSFRRGHL